MKSHSGPLAVSWVITVTDTQIDRPGPPPPFLQNTPQGTDSAWKTNRQTNTTVALIYKIMLLFSLNVLI